MSLFNLPVVHKEKPVSTHPWSKSIKDEYSSKIKYAHNSVRNVVYPKPKEKVPYKNRITFTVIGNRVTREFIYCVHLVKGMHKYRWKSFGEPVIRGVTSIEWPDVLKDVKIKYGGLAYCILGQVVVLYNDQFLGGAQELKDLIETRHSYHLAIDYERESVWQFINFIKSTGNPCAYFHISLGEEPIGTLIFMLYSEICPVTCENFLRLCATQKGGYSGTPIHRIVKDGWIQCGGFGLKDVPMSCENFIIPQDRRGVLGMCNAGRHTDCSTQFFVLLQPAEWMKSNFVAFGQLIDGEQTLRRIEKVPTYYESPIVDLTIHKAGILNVDCHNITINKNTNAYIESHIEDLVAIGEIFYAMLMERVFLEIEFRLISKLDGLGEGEAVEGEHERMKDVRATKRFIRKKEELQSRADSQAADSKHSDKGDNENNEFDVEDYSYEPEEYVYPQASPAPEVLKEEPKKQPFYIPLTDVPYPGEVDSNYDLKRFLQGDYCLESDLDPEAMEKATHDQQFDIEKLNDLYEMLESYKKSDSDDNDDGSSASDSDMDLDSDDEREIKKYLQIYGERASFPGKIVKRVGRKFVNTNPLENETGTYTDEEVRRLKLAFADMKTREAKRVSITVEPWETTHKQIKRRQTGFMRPGDLRALLARQMAEEDEEDEDEENKQEYGDGDQPGEEEEEEEEPPSEYHSRKVSISVPDENYAAQKIKRRQTGFVRPEDLARIMAFQKHLEDEEDDEIEEGKKGDEDLDVEETKLKVRIDPHFHEKHKKPRLFESDRAMDDDEYNARPSVLVRLYDDVALFEEPVPTLKDYKPMAEKATKNILLTVSSNLRDTDLLKRNDFRPSITYDDDSFEQILTIQHGKKIARKISSDYVKTIDQIERKPETSLRTVEFARTRPSLTVSEYQLKNQKHAMEVKQKEDKEKEKKLKKAAATAVAKEPQVNVSRGLRLPGDTPLYASLQEVNENLETGNKH